MAYTYRMKVGICNAFSLIELMVVIAIVGLLAAVAVPAYKAYTTKTIVTQGVTLMERISKDLQQQYESTGAYPASIIVNGVTIANASWGIVNVGDVYGVSYTVGSSTNGFMLQASLLGLNAISGYVTPGSGTVNSANSTLSYSIIQTNGLYKVHCGQYPDGNDIPLAYLPASCQCTGVSGGDTC